MVKVPEGGRKIIDNAKVVWKILEYQSNANLSRRTSPHISALFFQPVHCFVRPFIILKKSLKVSLKLFWGGHRDPKSPGADNKGIRSLFVIKVGAARRG
jgi:hypothetical protein